MELGQITVILVIKKYNLSQYMHYNLYELIASN